MFLYIQYTNTIGLICQGQKDLQGYGKLGQRQQNVTNYLKY